MVAQNRNSPFANKILTEVVDASFRLPDLPKYDGTKDPQEHISAFELVMNLYGETDPINAKLFVTTLAGKSHEWFISLPSGTIESYDQLIEKFTFHFASKKKARRSATYLFTIRQREDESLESFIGRFNNEILEVHDLRIYMMKYIDEEEMNAMKEGECASSSKRDRGREGREREYILRESKADDRERASEQRDDGRRSRIAERFRGRNRKEGKIDNAPMKGVIHTIAEGPAGGDSATSRKRYVRYLESDRRSYQIMSVDKDDEIIFEQKDLEANEGSQNDPMVIRMAIANFIVHKVLVDNGSSVDILFMDVLRKMGIGIASLRPVSTPLIGFGGSEVIPLGTIDLSIYLSSKIEIWYWRSEVRAEGGKKEAEESKKMRMMERIEPVEEHKEIELVPDELEKTTRIGLNVNPQAKPVKQKKRSFEMERNRIIEEEVKKLLKAGYVAETEQSMPEGPYPLLWIDLLVDSTTGCALFSMMDSYQGKEEEEHLNHLQPAFEVMRKYGMKLNPTKCTFGVRGEKFLGYMVSDKGIKANLEKNNAIMQMSLQKTIKDVQKLTGEPEQQRKGSWMLHVDGSSTSSAGGAGILLQGPGGVEIEIAAKLDFPTTNKAEYEALTMGLEIALEAGVKQLDVILILN
ncbi:UNVERIFIED_CONTAM: hypothetical protein Scaly_0995100, partial [Sesamum calycinum]